MKLSKGSHRIVVRDVLYRWRATGNDGWIDVGIWPVDREGPFICGNLKYHETWPDQEGGIEPWATHQIVITNRIVRRIIEHAVAERGYDPNVKGPHLNLEKLDGTIVWDDAVRAMKGAAT